MRTEDLKQRRNKRMNRDSVLARVATGAAVGGAIGGAVGEILHPYSLLGFVAKQN